MSADIVCQILLSLCGLWFLFSAWSVIYVYYDAEKRYWNGIYWALLAAAAPLIGFVIYLILRNSRIERLDSLKLEIKGVEKMLASGAQHPPSVSTTPSSAISSTSSYSPSLSSIISPASSLSPSSAAGASPAAPLPAVLYPDKEKSSEYLKPVNRTDWKNVLSAA
ncbi:MAG: hypothetical protein QW728_05605, partial [Thermoplasmata archaeon]